MDEIINDLTQTLRNVAAQNMKSSVDQILTHTALQLVKMTKDQEAPEEIAAFLEDQREKLISFVEDYKKLIDMTQTIN